MNILNIFKPHILFLLILLLAAGFRFYGQNWDQGFHLHPDERMLVMVTTSIQWPDKLNPEFFAYGSLPIYLLRIAAWLLEGFDPLINQYEKINLLGRSLSALFDLGTLTLLYLLAKKLFNKSVAIISSFFYALSVLPIQLSHFYAVDTPLTFFTLLALLLLTDFNQTKKLRYLSLTGIIFGLALATKTSALLLSVPIFLSAVLSYSHFPIKKLVCYLLLTTSYSLLTFLSAEPYALLDFSTFYRQTLEQQAMTRDAFTFPYTLQYVGKIPYYYELTNIYFFGVGPIIGSIALPGIIYLTITTLQRLRQRSFDSPLIILLTFFYLYLLIVGGFAIGFMRYMLPIYPILCLAGGFLTYQLYLLISQSRILSHPIPYTVYPIPLILCLIWPLSFISIYSSDNTRVTATKWINQNIPAGSTLAREHWDDGLPLVGYENFNLTELPLYEFDTPQKWTEINQTLLQTDYIIIASNRLYVPLGKLLDCDKLPVGRCYLQTDQYYQDLFSGKLGFRKVAEFSSYPRIPFSNLYVNDFDADESFTVYDHPKVMIFQKLGVVSSQ